MRHVHVWSEIWLYMYLCHHYSVPTHYVDDPGHVIHVQYNFRIRTTPGSNIN